MEIALRTALGLGRSVAGTELSGRRSTEPITVAIPVLNGGSKLKRVLDAVRDQDYQGPVEVLVCDSGSDDGSVALANAAGVQVIEIARSAFSHGGTRNLLMTHASGTYVTFLTQDAVPARPAWLSSLLSGFDLAEDVALVYGPYEAEAAASASVRRELTQWFTSISPDGLPRVDRLGDDERPLRPGSLIGPRAFFTDANGCVRRDAWRQVPFREIPYAEDHRLALDMLDAGFAKAFVPDAAVVHSHEYSAADRVRRGFDESRALREVYGFVAPAGVRALRAAVVGNVRADLRMRRREGASGAQLIIDLRRSVAHHAARHLGAVLGCRADRLPRGVRGHLSLEGRSTFVSSKSADAR